MPVDERPPDRRVARSRAALFAAAVRLVTERGTTAVPITELAEAADLSRQAVYLHFANRDEVLVAAAADLARREMAGAGEGGGRSALLAAVGHFAGHREFYRAMLSGPCAFALTRALGDLLAPVNRHLLGTLVDVAPGTLDDLAVFVTGGMGALINAWLLDEAHPDPEEFADRLARLWRGLGLTAPADLLTR
ncbi:TetR/AcrR family transcriptional regulator [Amycolatopsis magusensis]|uniref:TetR/AcrR family transcriptional regulator n=1 Tax=Amycolatopsis magusensis TaxID=882444 RepID=UPI003C2E75C5